MFVRETAVMRSMKHTHLLPLYATSVEAHYLWIITPFVSGGTLENILHHAFQQGFYEKVIATISKMVLEALDYLHKHGIVHRDIKVCICPFGMCVSILYTVCVYCFMGGNDQHGASHASQYYPNSTAQSSSYTDIQHSRAQ